MSWRVQRPGNSAVSARAYARENVLASIVEVVRDDASVRRMQNQFRAVVK
jgi:hypothetical protein